MTENERNEFIEALGRTELLIVKQEKAEAAFDAQIDVLREKYDVAHELVCKLRRTAIAIKALLETPTQEPDPQEDLPLDKDKVIGGAT